MAISVCCSLFIEKYCDGVYGEDDISMLKKVLDGKIKETFSERELQAFIIKESKILRLSKVSKEIEGNKRDNDDILASAVRFFVASGQKFDGELFILFLKNEGFAKNKLEIEKAIFDRIEKMKIRLFELELSDASESEVASLKDILALFERGQEELREDDFQIQPQQKVYTSLVKPRREEEVVRPVVKQKKDVEQYTYDNRSFVSRLIAGDISLVKTYWVYNVLVGVLLNLVGRVLGETAPPVVNLLFGTLAVLYGVVLLVALWRSSDKYAGPSIWAMLAKGVCVLGGIILISIFGLVTALS